MHRIKTVIIALVVSAVVFIAFPAFGDGKTIRLATVNTPAFSGLLDALLPEFEKNSGYIVQVYSSSDVYDKARDGKADIVLSHYGKSPVESFVQEGLGSWPVMVFSNQAVLIGPKEDPAKVRGLTSVSEAFEKIADSQSPYIVNRIPVIQYLNDVIWQISGQQEKGSWYIQEAVVNAQATKLAEEKKGYLLWGSSPFLKYQHNNTSNLEILVSEDPLLQRVMATVLVNPDKFDGVNAAGAKALQDYLLLPETQAKVAEFREKGSEAQLWWPAGRNN